MYVSPNAVLKQNKLRSAGADAQALGSLFVFRFVTLSISVSLRCTSSSPADKLVLQCRAVRPRNLPRPNSPFSIIITSQPLMW